jgi:hypothetical protein
VAGGGGSSSGGGSRIGGGGGGGGSARPGPASVTESLAQAPAPEVDPDDAAPGSGEPRPETAVDKKEIHTHKLPWQAYALASSNRKGSRWSYRYAVGSFIEDYCNKVQVRARRGGGRGGRGRGAAARAGAGMAGAARDRWCN